MNFPEKSQINITQLRRRPPADPSPDPTDSCPRKRKPFLPAPFHHIFAKSEPNVKTHPKSKTNILWKQGPPKN